MVFVFGFVGVFLLLFCFLLVFGVFFARENEDWSVAVILRTRFFPRIVFLLHLKLSKASRAVFL